MTDFTNRTAIVTGGTRGIGGAISTAFLAAGATVLAIYGGNKAGADAFQEQTSTLPGTLHTYQCDVSSEQAVHDFYALIETKFDKIDILVNNAGIRQDAIVALMSTEQWRRVIDINLTGTFLMSKEAVKLMISHKFGRIINITSPMSYLGFVGQANYAASKAGQIGFTKSLSKETAKKKITVNCVSPGFIATELLEDLSADQVKEYKKMVPVKRFGTVEEVSDAVLFLASDKASYITGSVLEVTGGI